MEGQLEVLACVVVHERPHLEVALDLRLRVRRPADRSLWGNERGLPRVVQERRWAVVGHGHHALPLNCEV